MGIFHKIKVGFFSVIAAHLKLSNVLCPDFESFIAELQKVFEAKNITTGKSVKHYVNLHDAAKGFYNLAVTTGGTQKNYKLVVQ